MPPTQTHRQASVKTALGEDVLLFEHLHGTEELGRLFEFTVTLGAESHDLNVADVLGTEMTVKLETGAGVRYFNGIVTRFEHAGKSRDLARYVATVRPAAARMAYASDCRIFQDRSVLDIVKEVCGAYGGDLKLSEQLSDSYNSLPYCVQYRETDLDFVLRLLEGAGIYFYFTHDANSHTMVLTDSHGPLTPFPGYEQVLFSGKEPELARKTEALTRWAASGAITSSAVVLNNYDYEKSGGSQSGSLVARTTVAAAFAQASYEMYDYPGSHVTAADGRVASRARIESLHGQGERIAGGGYVRGLRPGSLFKLAEHPRADQKRQFLVTSAIYTFGSNGYASGGGDFDFSCDFTAIGTEHAFRPLRVMPRPIVAGPQTAIVVGKVGEEIWTDKYGRVKVQFHWDRLGKSDENSSCWVRVAQGWAGKGWGAMSLPRIGMEVVVSFLEGDPDRPLVTGCVYNSDAMPPYALPAEQTVSTVKSQSSKGGAGFNELRFEDMKGDEEIFMHAERDFLRVVKNNDALKVGFETADKGDQTIDIKNDQTETIGNDQTLTVTNDQTVKIDGKQAVKVGSTIVIEAGTSIELKVGGSSIKIEAGKITIKAPEIEIAADANAKVKAGAMMEVKSGAIMTIAGALVQIN